MKKFLSIFLGVSIACASAIPVFASTEFPDVENLASYGQAVQVLSDLNIVNGDDNGLFNPENEVTRAEFTKMAVEALGEGEAATSQSTSKFNDAANTSVHWAAGYVAQGVADGFIDGYDDTTFGPDDKVTFAQACKMLVAALGYTTYAENAGGWPAGYVAQASSIGISKGVSVGNDTNLTRAECAILIYNALQTPLCMLAGYTPVANVAGGFVQAPTFKIYDGTDAYGSVTGAEDYKTLFTTRHNVYTAKGRVTSTYKSDGALDTNEIRFDVELSDNFNEKKYDQTKIGTSGVFGTESYRMYIGDTNAQDMMFEYAKVIVSKDEDADKYTIISIEKFGESKTVTFKANDVELFKMVDSIVGVGVTPAINNINAGGKIEVLKSKSSTSTTKYNFDNNLVKMYVNGQMVATSTAATGTAIPLAATAYIANNNAGTVTLIDATNAGTTSTDGYYDFIMVDHYIDAVVSSVSSSITTAKIYTYGTSGTTSYSNIKWSEEDDDVAVTLKTVGGKDVDISELNEFDILTIKASPGLNLSDIGTRKDDDFADIVVSTDSIEGRMTSADTYDATIDIDGASYDVINTSLVDTNRYETNANNELNSEYTFYLDMFGYVAWVEEGKTSATYGMVVGMYKSVDGSSTIAKIITGDGYISAYECKTGGTTSQTIAGTATDTETALRDALTGSTAASTYPISKDTVSGTGTIGSERILTGKTFISYKLSGGKITNVRPLGNNVTAINGEYRETTSKVDGCTINEMSSQIVNLENYISDDDANIMSSYDFINEDTYTGFAYRKPGTSSSAYNFVGITSGLTSLGRKTPLAVVSKKSGTTLANDDQECTRYIVCVNGKEDQEVLFDTALGTNFNEGDVIQYVVNSKGYVDSYSKYNQIIDAMTWNNYSNVFDSVTFYNDFNDIILDSNNIFNNNHANTLPKPSDSLSFGIVYRQQGNNLEIFLSQSLNESAIANVFDFATSGVNLYKVNYTNKVKYRVEVGGISQASSIFTTADLGGGTYVRNPNTDTVNWANAKSQEVAPSFALVRIYDNDEADVVYYTGEF